MFWLRLRYFVMRYDAWLCSNIPFSLDIVDACRLRFVEYFGYRVRLTEWIAFTKL